MQQGFQGMGARVMDPFAKGSLTRKAFIVATYNQFLPQLVLAATNFWRN